MFKLKNKNKFKQNFFLLDIILIKKLLNFCLTFYKCVPSNFNSVQWPLYKNDNNRQKSKSNYRLSIS